MIDTHTHIYLEEFDADRDEVMRRAFDAGVRHWVFPNADSDPFAAMHRLHDAYPSSTPMPWGFHPHRLMPDICRISTAPSKRL